MYLDCINDNFTFNMTSDNVFEVSMYLDCIGNLIILNAHMMKSTPTYSKIADILKQGKNSRIANI